MSEFERHMRKQRERGQAVRKANRAVAAYTVWIVVGVIALVLALLLDSTALVIVVGAVVAIVILGRMLARSQR